MTLADWPRRVAAVAQFTVSDPCQPLLEDADEHHLRRVLRARVGEEVVVADGVGGWTICAVSATGLEPLTELRRDPVPASTALYLVPLKGDRSEWAVAKATELGVGRIVPLVSERLAARFVGDSRERTMSRWRRVAAEATGQCRRTYRVEFDDPVTPVQVPADVAVADLEGADEWRDVRAVAIGPEGGWAPGEWSDRRRLGLGPTVLRAETAAVVAAALLAQAAGSWAVTARGDGAGKDEGTR